MDIYKNFNLQLNTEFIINPENSKNIEMFNLIEKYNKVKFIYAKQYSELKNTFDALQSFNYKIKLLSDSSKYDEIKKSIIDITNLF